jgi:hypothetical protein
MMKMNDERNGGMRKWEETGAPRENPRARCRPPRTHMADPGKYLLEVE